ncbi:4Fe-4S dicluster domain-containing protein [Thermococci archaeon]|nr:MAG: 4Fe-4S dicluster domain-containing protein [Thermococci archaeon]
MKVIIFEPEKCSGCRTCELVCSVKHTNYADPMRSLIRILKREEYIFIPIRCRQCEEPWCEIVCPVGAISKDKELGTVTVDYDKCRGCRLCTEICPFGGAQWKVKDRQVMMCDLCKGDPACVKCCPTEALQYVEEDEIPPAKREKLFAIYAGLMETYKGVVR